MPIFKYRVRDQAGKAILGTIDAPTLQGAGDRLGSVYAADLFGSALGALLTAGFFIPIWGVPQTLIFLGAANVLIPLLFFFKKRT